MNEKATFLTKGDQLVVNGIVGKTDIEVDLYGKDVYVQGPYYLFGKETVLGYKGNKPFVKNAVKLQTKQEKKPIALYLRPANGGKHMALTWRKVKKAKSYVVYKYDEQVGKYRKEAVRNGEGANYYMTPADGSKSVKYKVAAMSKKNGKGKRIGKKSYAVSAVMADSNKGNAVKVEVQSKGAIKMKKGKRLKLSAKAFSDGKPLYSDSIRWNTSNKKVVKISKKTGKLIAKKKGTCYVWAKAHNGMNSKKIKVIVK